MDISPVLGASGGAIVVWAIVAHVSVINKASKTVRSWFAPTDDKPE